MQEFRDRDARVATTVLATCGMPHQEIWANPGLYTGLPNVARMLVLDRLYRRILRVHGDVMQFGVKWGQDLVWLHHFRVLYEPLVMRRIIGFDTFAGFPSVHPYDGDHAVGELATSEGYEHALTEVLDGYEATIYGRVRQFSLVKGDVRETLPRYLEERPWTMIALAYFDLDLYEPTKACLEAIQPYLTKGAVLVFDELNDPVWSGETRALREVAGLGRWAIQRTPQSRTISYCVVD